MIIILIGFSFYQWVIGKDNNSNNASVQKDELRTSKSPDKNKELIKAFKDRRSDVQLKGSGAVVKLLRDDNKGSRHQKFILKLPSGLTVLVAHNIDLAPRINSISKGDTVEFYGEYEWNKSGGIMHWTHKDPNGYHVAGWLKHNGKIYQ